MTDFVAQDGGSGDWADTSSWDHGSQIPSQGGVGTDIALFNDRCSVDFLTNLDRIDNGLSPPTPDNALLRVITTPDYPGTVGSSANPLYHEIASTGTSNGRIVHRSPGQFFFKGNAGGFSDVYVDSQRDLSTAAMTLDGTLRNVVTRRGRTVINGSATVAGVLIQAGRGVTVLNAGVGTVPKVVVAMAGTIDFYRDASGSSSLHNVIVLFPGAVINMYGRFNDNTLIINAHGVLNVAPTSAPTSSHNPELITDLGNVDLSKAAYAHEFSNVFLGPNAGINGTVLQQSVIGPLATFLDMRLEVP